MGALVGWLLWGCSSQTRPGDVPPPVDLPAPDSGHSGAVHHSAAGTPAHSGAAHSGGLHSAGGHTAAPDEGLYPDVPYDCQAGVPGPPFQWRVLQGIRTTEDLAFTPDGWMVSANTSQDLLRFLRDGTVELWAPDVGETRGLDVLPDGAVVFTNPDLGTIHRVDSNGSASLIASLGSQPSGIDVAADGSLAVADLNGFVSVVDSTTGDVTRWGRVAAQLYGTAFSVDETRIHFASYSPGDRTIYATDRAPDGTWPAPAPWSTQGPPLGLAGMATDACGNVYAMEAFTCSLWRFAPDGSAEELLQLSLPQAYCPALAFGRGVGGWGAEQLYVSTYFNVVEVDIGVPGRPR